MSFEEGDRVVLRDRHSEHDGEVGTVSQVMETMFGDANYTVQFEAGQETGLAAAALEPAPDDAGPADESDDAGPADESGETGPDEDDAGS